VKRETHRGLPQGSVLSPLLYIIYTAQLGQSLPPGCKIIEFADDVCLFSSVTPLEAAVRITGGGVNSIGEVLQALGLELSPQKTKLVVFSPNNRDLYKTRKGQREKDRED
jgi:hypothetical protein